MAERDATTRLRKAVKENNLFLVKRLIQRTEMRNPDPAPKRYTSLAWAAVLGHEETFEFLLTAGHDDEELSRDSENNTILMLLADHKPSVPSPYSPAPPNADIMGAALRMARLYYDRYSWILDWSNMQGKTALHISALKGNEELVRMLCDLGADFDLSDNKGNTPLHYASSWGHIPVVQLLIERGCQFAARNNEGFTASDYAYSFSTKDTLQDTARSQFENNKKSRRNVYAHAAARGSEWDSAHVALPQPIPSKARDIRQVSSRLRSGSGTSRTTATSDSGELEGTGHSFGPHSISSSSSPSQPSAHSASSSSFLHISQSNSSTGGTFSALAPGAPPPMAGHPGSATSTLSPIVTRMRERDADAMEKYMKRNRSGSQGASSSDAMSQSGSHFSSAGPSANGDDITSLTPLSISGSVTPRRRLRPSMSAAQLRTTPESLEPPLNGMLEVRNRSGTSPGSRPSLSPLSLHERSPSTSYSPRFISPSSADEEKGSYTGPPSQYAQFPEPPLPPGPETSTPTGPRRLAFHLLSKQSSNTDTAGGPSHRRGASAASVRGS